MPKVAEPARDVNGIPILPGYRPPFNSERGRAASLKAHAALRAERERFKILPKPIVAKERGQKELTGLINAIRRAIRRHISASVASTDAKQALLHAKTAREWIEAEQDLLGNGSPRSKRSKSPVISPLDLPMPDPSGNQGVSKPVVEPASEQVTQAPVPSTPEIDDTPF